MARSNSSGSTRAAAGGSKKPKKQRWYHQVWAVYKMTHKQDPSVTWIMLGVFLVIVLVAEVIGLLWGHPIYTLIVGIPFGLLGAMFVLSRKAEKAAYTQIEGQPGAARAALGTVRGGWTFEDEPVAVDPRNQDFVFRGVGRAGVVLVSEGPSHRAKKLLDKERKRTTRVLPNVPVTTIQCGDGPDQVPLTKVARSVSKLKKQLTRNEVAEIGKRLKALGGAKLPIPKGVDPTRMRPDRKAMRGR